MAIEVVTEKINLEEVGRYFEAKGYKVQKLEQKWRHVTGLVKFENEKLFVKMASTAEIGDRTKNEAAWNQKTNTVWKKSINTFSTPKMFDDGTYEKKYWFVASFIYGKPLAELGKLKVDINKNDLLAAAKIAKEIMNISQTVLLPKDEDQLKECGRERALTSAMKWSQNSKVSTKSLLQFIKEKNNDIEIGASHGDFTPWHILKSKEGKYFLIDGESGQVAGMKFYDVAYFYHRVYTKMQRPDLAKVFLEKFREIYGWTESDQKAFEPVLALRIMGGFFDAERDTVTSGKLNRELEGRLLAGKI